MESSSEVGSYKSTNKSMEVENRMIAHYYFDWDGPRENVNEYGEKLEKACNISDEVNLYQVF